MSIESKTVYTIGHSRHPMDKFLQLLQPYGIQTVIDVRSKPVSRFASQFNRKRIEPELQQHGLQYLFYGDMLGGMPVDKEYRRDDDSIDYEKLAVSELFIKGLDAVEARINAGDVMVLMCTEKHPSDCHRYSLIGAELAKRGVQVVHLLSEGGHLTQDDVR